jgi:hypothetical protein
MRIICPRCKGKAIIASRSKLSDFVFNLYCICKDARSCGVRFVYKLYFEHYIQEPSALQVDASLTSSQDRKQIERF